ncbi:MAG: DUF4145 domain-containing protein [Limisphaerales bacterium]
MSRIVPPSIRETAFCCPHCSAFTTQFWFTLGASALPEKEPLPFLATEKGKQAVKDNEKLTENQKKMYLNWLDQLLAGLVVIEREGGYTGKKVDNLWLSKCYNCKKVAVWVSDRLLFPATKVGVPPNPDLPEEILHDFEEAREIVNSSPRGAAALLRLCIQKLCSHLGEKGKNIDKDIGSLVKKGLNPLVQKSLDIVRVIGNEAVHPGVIDLKDDRDTALHLLEMVNAIAEQMISHPKAVNDMYAKLPEAKRKAIKARDGK